LSTLLGLDLTRLGPERMLLGCVTKRRSLPSACVPGNVSATSLTGAPGVWSFGRLVVALSALQPSRERTVPSNIRRCGRRPLQKKLLALGFPAFLRGDCYCSQWGEAHGGQGTTWPSRSILPPAAGHSAFPSPPSQSVRTLAPTEQVSEFSAAQKDEGRIVGVGRSKAA
jgi:hypothetical protein